MRWRQREGKGNVAVRGWVSKAETFTWYFPEQFSRAIFQQFFSMRAGLAPSCTTYRRRHGRAAGYRAVFGAGGGGGTSKAFGCQLVSVSCVGWPTASSTSTGTVVVVSTKLHPSGFWILSMLQLSHLTTTP